MCDVNILVVNRVARVAYGEDAWDDASELIQGSMVSLAANFMRDIQRMIVDIGKIEVQGEKSILRGSVLTDVAP